METPPQAPSGDSGAFVLSVALALLAAGALLFSAWFPADLLPRLPLCPFHTVTGLPCPGCGLTHAFCCIGHGEFSRAWAFNPFSFLFYALCLGLLLWPAFQRFWPNAERRLLNARWFSRGLVVMLAAMGIFGVWRIWHEMYHS